MIVSNYTYQTIADMRIPIIMNHIPWVAHRQGGCLAYWRLQDWIPAVSELHQFILCTRHSGGTAHVSVGGATCQLDLPSMMASVYVKKIVVYNSTKVYLSIKSNNTSGECCKFCIHLVYLPASMTYWMTSNLSICLQSLLHAYWIFLVNKNNYFASSLYNCENLNLGYTVPSPKYV